MDSSVHAVYKGITANVRRAQEPAVIVYAEWRSDASCPNSDCHRRTVAAHSTGPLAYKKENYPPEYLYILYVHFPLAYRILYFHLFSTGLFLRYFIQPLEHDGKIPIYRPYKLYPRFFRRR
ncbi:MAG: hypothetical protein LBQ14_09705 [Treponema sp.]|nr:hypothetical protein [Treponema sp.]